MRKEALAKMKAEITSFRSKLAEYEERAGVNKLWSKMSESWLKSEGQNRDERFRDVAQSLHTHLLGKSEGKGQ